MLALGLAAGTVRTTPTISRLLSSAQTVHQNFKQLKTGAVRLSTMERFVYSIVLTKTPGEPQRHS
jgi:hypothetical protein